MTHNRTDPNTCDICSQSFSSERELQEHQSNAHHRQAQGGKSEERQKDHPGQEGDLQNEWGTTKNIAKNAGAGAMEPRSARPRPAPPFNETDEEETAEDVLQPRRMAS